MPIALDSATADSFRTIATDVTIPRRPRATGTDRSACVEHPEQRDTALVRAALEWLSERTRVTPTEGALGIEARVRGLLSEGEAAERPYRDSIVRRPYPRPRGTRPRPSALRRVAATRRRRVDAREQLRTAHEMFASMGLRRSPTAPAASCWPRARGSANARWKRATSSPPKRL